MLAPSIAATVEPLRQPLFDSYWSASGLRARLLADLPQVTHADNRGVAVLLILLTTLPPPFHGHTPIKSERECQLKDTLPLATFSARRSGSSGMVASWWRRLAGWWRLWIGTGWPSC